MKKASLPFVQCLLAMARIHHYNVCKGRYLYIVIRKEASIKNALPFYIRQSF